jgi:uncharacterized protein YdeI (BOF family)
MHGSENRFVCGKEEAMKRIPAVVAMSGMALLLSSLGQAVHADGFIDQPRPLTLTSFENAGRTSLVAAGADISIHNLGRLPDGRRVRLIGTVESLHGSRDFVLRDETGRVEVNMNGNKKIAIRKGMEVVVAGRINRGIMGANIDASAVTPRAGFNQAALEEKPAKPVSAPAYVIQKLPESGPVKVSGVVTTSENDREFTLKDATGLVDVSVVEGDASNVMKGSRVTVVGTVDRGVLGKDISASHITVEKNPQIASAE